MFDGVSVPDTLNGLMLSSRLVFSFIRDYRDCEWEVLPEEIIFVSPLYGWAVTGLSLMFFCSDLSVLCLECSWLSVSVLTECCASYELLFILIK